MSERILEITVDATPIGPAIRSQLNPSDVADITPDRAAQAIGLALLDLKLMTETYASSLNCYSRAEFHAAMKRTLDGEAHKVYERTVVREGDGD